MSIIASYMVPHPPMIIPQIGGGREKQIQQTIDAYRSVAREIASLKPETIIISSPHSVMYSDYFHISPGKDAYGDFRSFHAQEIRFDEFDTFRYVYNESVANNHWLNTVAIAAAERLIGVSYCEFAIRLPNLVFFAIYCAFVCIGYQKRMFSFLCASFLLLNYYLDEFYGLARGYAMAQTCVFAAAWFYLRWKNSRYRGHGNLIGCALSLMIGTYANTVVFLVFPAFGIKNGGEYILPFTVPFNLIKGGLNAAIAMLIYDPIAKGLRAARLIPPSSHTASPADRRKTSLAVTIISALVLLGLILAALAIAGIL